MAKAEKGKTEKATGLGRKTKEENLYIEKWDQTESPEIPDGGETAEISGHPFWGTESKRANHANPVS